MELLTDREGYNGNMVSDANKYYNKNINGIYEDANTKIKIDESEMAIVGKKWLYLEESNNEIIVETEKVEVKGMEYKAKVFKKEDDANKWLEKNKDWGVIKTEKGKIYVAKKSDKGKKIEESIEISENVKNAGQWL